MGFKQSLTILAIFLLAIPISLASQESRTLAIDDHLYSFQPLSEGKLYLAVRNKVYFSENNGKSWSYTLSSKYDPSEVLYLLKDGSIIKMDTATSAAYRLEKHKWQEYKKTPTPRPLELSGVYVIKKDIGQSKKLSEIFTEQLVTPEQLVTSEPGVPVYSVDINNKQFSWIPSDIRQIVVTESTLSVNLFTLDLLTRNGFVLSDIAFREGACNLPYFPVDEQCFMVDLNVYKNNYEYKRNLIDVQYPITSYLYNPTCDTGSYNPSNCNIVILRISKGSLPTLEDVYLQESMDAMNIWSQVMPVWYG